MQKPVKGLGVDYLVEIFFRDISVYPSSDMAQQAQLWLYDPMYITKEKLWHRYYNGVFVPLLLRIRAHLQLPPRLSDVQERKALAFPIGSRVMLKQRSVTSGPFTVVAFVEKKYRLQNPSTMALLDGFFKPAQLVMCAAEVAPEEVEEQEPSEDLDPDSAQDSEC